MRMGAVMAPIPAPVVRKRRPDCSARYTCTYPRVCCSLSGINSSVLRFMESDGSVNMTAASSG